LRSFVIAFFISINVYAAIQFGCFPKINYVSTFLPALIKNDESSKGRPLLSEAAPLRGAFSCAFLAGGAAF